MVVVDSIQSCHAPTRNMFLPSIFKRKCDLGNSNVFDKEPERPVLNLNFYRNLNALLECLVFKLKLLPKQIC